MIGVAAAIITDCAPRGFRQAVELAARIVNGMAADHRDAGQYERAEALYEAVEQIRTLPKDLP